MMLRLCVVLLAVQLLPALSLALDFKDCELYTEKTLAASVGPHRLIAKYDLIAVRSGKAVIYDWKTYARRPREEWLAARLQTRVYRLMLQLAGADLNSGRPFEPADISMVYWFAEFPTAPANFTYDEQQFNRDQAAVTTLVQEVSRLEQFSLTEDLNNCRFCVYRSFCDRGSVAGLWKDADTDASEEAVLDLDFEQISEIEF